MPCPIARNEPRQRGPEIQLSQEPTTAESPLRPASGLPQRSSASPHRGNGLCAGPHSRGPEVALHPWRKTRSSSGTSWKQLDGVPEENSPEPHPEPSHVQPPIIHSRSPVQQARSAGAPPVPGSSSSHRLDVAEKKHAWLVAATAPLPFKCAAPPPRDDNPQSSDNSLSVPPLPQGPKPVAPLAPPPSGAPLHASPQSGAPLHKRSSAPSPERRRPPRQSDDGYDGFKWTPTTDEGDVAVPLSPTTDASAPASPVAPIPECTSEGEAEWWNDSEREEQEDRWWNEQPMATHLAPDWEWPAAPEYVDWAAVAEWPPHAESWESPPEHWIPTQWAPEPDHWEPTPDPEWTQAPEWSQAPEPDQWEHAPEPDQWEQAPDQWERFAEWEHAPEWTPAPDVIWNWQPPNASTWWSYDDRDAAYAVWPGPRNSNFDDDGRRRKRKRGGINAPAITARFRAAAQSNT